MSQWSKLTRPCLAFHQAVVVTDLCVDVSDRRCADRHHFIPEATCGSRQKHGGNLPKCRFRQASNFSGKIQLSCCGLQPHHNERHKNPFVLCEGLNSAIRETLMSSKLTVQSQSSWLCSVQAPRSWSDCDMLEKKPQSRGDLVVQWLCSLCSAEVCLIHVFMLSAYENAFYPGSFYWWGSLETTLLTLEAQTVSSLQIMRNMWRIDSSETMKINLIATIRFSHDDSVFVIVVVFCKRTASKLLEVFSQEQGHRVLLSHAGFSWIYQPNELLFLSAAMFAKNQSNSATGCCCSRQTGTHLTLLSVCTDLKCC